jgi:hypothetical protein
VNLVLATNEQVIEWFETRPEYKELLIEDMRKKLGLHFLKIFDYVFDYSKFWIHPIVGIIPDYSLIELEFQFGEVEDDPEWESRGDFEGFGRRIYKRLWFIIWVKIDNGEIDSGFDQLSTYEDIEKRFIDEDAVFFSNLEDYYYGWQERIFSNGRRFVPINENPNIDADELLDSEEIVESRSPDGEIEMSASVVNLEDGRIFVKVSFHALHLMEVASNEEAKTILAEIWN